ncbi:MAG: Uma2 family endonuclease [bacterium]|nr:Uma2 family endonuclease [bacterium]
MDTATRPAPGYAGLRMTADEYLALPPDGERYELVEGVVVMSPSPVLRHQAVSGEVFFQLQAYLRSNPIGFAFFEVDVRLGRGVGGRDLVFRPDLIYVRRERFAVLPAYVTGAPDVACEVVSPGYRRYDRETKRTEYERHGVLEYWLFDPEDATTQLWRLEDGRYIDVTPPGDAYPSAAVPGFVLDLAPVRALLPELSV